MRTCPTTGNSTALLSTSRWIRSAAPRSLPVLRDLVEVLRDLVEVLRDLVEVLRGLSAIGCLPTSAAERVLDFLASVFEVGLGLVASALIFGSPVAGDPAAG